MNLEKQVKQIQKEKVDLDIKYQERVYFIESKTKEQQEAITNEFNLKMKDLTLQNKKLAEDLKNLRAKSRPEASTGISIVLKFCQRPYRACYSSSSRE
jgi:uncharacterized membrane protein YqiK